MINYSHIFALHDYDQELKKRGAFHIDKSEAMSFNREGFGIFGVVNPIKSEKRIIDNLEYLKYIYADIDIGKKEDIMRLISNFARPTFVIETKRGYHVYYEIENKIDLKEYKLINRYHLADNLPIDVNATDPVRLLRVPSYYHQKEPSNRFLVNVAYSSDAKYSSEALKYMFPLSIKSAHELAQKNEIQYKHSDTSPGGDFWDKVFNLDCSYALSVLSSHDCVNSETFSTYSTTGNKKNILVNGKSTSCFIDANGKIGSMDGGGPDVGHWLNWYLKDWKQTYKVLSELFPELLEEK